MEIYVHLVHTYGTIAEVFGRLAFVWNQFLLQLLAQVSNPVSVGS